MKKKIEQTEIEKTVRSLVSALAQVLDADVELTSKLDEDLGLDSIDRAELECNLENAFGIELSIGQTFGITTVGELIELITSMTDGTL